MQQRICLLFCLLLGWCILTPACTPTPAASSKPSIILAAPPHGTEFREGDTIVVQSASSDAAGIARVELAVDGVFVRSDSAPSPQTYFNIIQNWKATPGAHTLAVRAYNTKGIASDPASVSITVLPAATPIPVVPTPSPVAGLPSPTAMVTPPPSAIAPSAATCADNSELVIETVPEGTALAPGQPFEKGWRMKNSGTCAWGEGYAFVFIAGEPMTPETIILLADKINPGEIADAWIEMTAPMTSGVHQGQWQMGTPRGALFGAIFKVSINVIGGAPPPADIAPPAGGAASPTTQFQLYPPMQTYKTATPQFRLYGPMQTYKTPTPQFRLYGPMQTFQTPTWTPHPGFGIVPSRTPTRR